MDSNAIKKFIAEKVPQGYSISKIQDMLKEQNVNITFMELRLLASEIESGLWKADEDKKAAAEKKQEEIAAKIEQAKTGDEAAPSEEPAISGRTTVEISPLARPGAVASGSVKFGSGVTAEWMLDQYGRLGLDKPTGKPTEQDIKEFQEELQKALG